MPTDREPHCPFLNRADHRCSSFFSIEQLQHAFEHCFHAYKACSVYEELLVERQARRGQVTPLPGARRFIWTTACGATAVARSESHVGKRNTTTPPFVQIRIPSLAAQAEQRADGYAKPVA